MNKLKIIIKDTYLRNIKSMSFLSMVFSPLLVIVAILAITYFISKPSVDPNIALISNDTELVSYLSQDSSGYTVNESINTVEKANSSLSSGDIVGYFVLNNENNYVTGEYTATTANDTLIGQINDKINLYRISNLSQDTGISSEILEAMNQSSTIQSSIVHVENGKIVEESKQNSLNKFISSAMCVLIFLFIMNYSVIIGQEISSEKGSKIMEVILSSTTAKTHFIGKLTGIFLMCLTQLGIYAVLGLGGYFFTKNNSTIQGILSGFTFSADLQKIIFVNLLYFMLSVIAFTLISALLASLVSRTEDVTKALQPLTLIGMGGFYLGIILAQNNPTSTIVKVMSYIPLFSNYTMPFRVSSNVVGFGAIAISLVIYLVFDLLLLKFSIKAYKINVLSY
ncbi:ABC transporter permease, partial [Listeria monocytogenes]|nr:ABC transporter permease [Listeria monocytogenes]